jgi:uncharacterized delta-60 repeat protein
MEKAQAGADLTRRRSATRVGRPVRSGAVLVAAVVVGVIFSAGAQAAPGDLDLTFSGDGKQRTNFGAGLSRAAAIVRQPDGKIVAVGTRSADGDSDFALARYNANGSLDPSFSGDGRQVTDFGGDFEVANGVALQADGKIIAVGHDDGGNFALARYNPNGSLDTSFSGDGRQTTDLGGFSDEAYGVAVQGNGKIVAVGTRDAAATAFDFALARYNPNGTLDTSFSGDGKQTTVFGGAASYDIARAVALQANGKIVAGGSTDIGFALARYNPNGSLDPSFSGDGKQTTDFGTDFDGATGVALQTDGKIVAAGRLGQGFFADPSDFALARYNPDGSLDPSFSGDGKQTTDFGGDNDGASGVALQGDGKVVVVGEAVGQNFNGDTLSDFALARYNPNGSLDPSFSGDGKQTTRFAGSDSANGVALQGNGKIVAVGAAAGFGFALAGYNPDGSLDPSFSGDGRQTTDSEGFDGATGVALQANGKIVAVGTSRFNGGDFALARYNPDGSLDPSFSGDGLQRTDFGTPFLGTFDRANGVAIQADGKIVAVGRTRQENRNDFDFALARYNPNGSLDTTFSGDGRQTTDSGEFLDEARGVALQTNGKIVVVGRGGAAFPPDFELARYNANGSLDTSFSVDGLQTTDFGFGADDAANGVAIQANGKIFAVGLAGGGTTGDDFALARYNPNGSLDTSFSGDGKQTTDFFFGAVDAANGVALQGDGKIVAAGVAGGGATASDFALARYNPDGSLDTSFSGDGRRRSNFGGADSASGVTLQADGRIVAAGSGLGTDRTSDFALARYLGG